MARFDGPQILTGAVRQSDRAESDILVSNAGISNATPFEKMTVREFDKLFAVNVRAPYFLIQQLLPPRCRCGNRLRQGCRTDRAYKSGNISRVRPAAALLIGFPITGEVPTPLQTGALCVVTVGLLLAIVSKQERSDTVPMRNIIEGGWI